MQTNDQPTNEPIIETILSFFSCNRTDCPCRRGETECASHVTVELAPPKADVGLVRKIHTVFGLYVQKWDRSLHVVLACWGAVVYWSTMSWEGGRRLAMSLESIATIRNIQTNTRSNEGIAEDTFNWLPSPSECRTHTGNMVAAFKPNRTWPTAR